MNNPLTALNADWMEIHTPDSFKRDVDPGFEWKGTGWYPKVNGSDTLLVLKLTDTPTNSYQFYVYNGRDPRKAADRQTSRLLDETPVRE